MKIQFYPRRAGVNHHLADAEVAFDDPGLAGLRLAGIALWSRRDGRPGVAVTLPSREYESTGAARRRYPFLRADREAMARFKAAVVAAFAERYPELAAPFMQR